VVIGGLGHDQTGDIINALRGAGAFVVSANYNEDIPAIVERNRRPKLALVGHSFGCQAVLQACEYVNPDYAAFVDPVMHTPLGADAVLPTNIGTVDWFRASKRVLFQARQATMLSGPEPIAISGDHNEIPHKPEVVERIVGRVRGL
jgi:hypothetical protein